MFHRQQYMHTIEHRNTSLHAPYLAFDNYKRNQNKNKGFFLPFGHIVEHVVGIGDRGRQRLVLHGQWRGRRRRRRWWCRGSRGSHISSPLCRCRNRRSRGDRFTPPCRGLGAAVGFFSRWPPSFPAAATDRGAGKPPRRPWAAALAAATN